MLVVFIEPEHLKNIDGLMFQLYGGPLARMRCWWYVRDDIHPSMRFLDAFSLLT